ncbi:WD40-repeat-containing domain [Phytophthora cinnamomi]|uniref:WD40-repeat-containing domain n=1 Tax=Phytophthora cinnamomi TaxID=4785 RepID=UPI0035593BE0|nr:WD40-repeat-containing domain [Phytophthora cinnamomi]
MRLYCVSLWLALLLSGLCLHVCGEFHHDDAVEEPTGLVHVLDAEIAATRQQLQLYKRKAELLGDSISQLQTQQGGEIQRNRSSSEAPGSDSATTQQRRQRSREAPQVFSDWFEPQGSFSSLVGNSSRVFAQLVSFRPNTSPVGRRQQAATRRKLNADDNPPLQFLLVLDPRSSVMSLFHPTTHEVMWQHALDLRSLSGSQGFQVADMFFVSDRSSHLALLSTLQRPEPPRSGGVRFGRSAHAAATIMGEEVRPTYLSERSLVDSFVHEVDIPPAPHVRVLGLSAAKDLLVHSTGFVALVAVPSKAGDRNTAGLRYQLQVYESRIPPPGTNIDLSWIRVPAMMICALAAMFWQQKGRLASSAGGRSAFNEAELAGMLGGRGGRISGMGAMKRTGTNTNRRASDCWRFQH